MIDPPGFLFWRRPTLARPIAVLPSGLQRFTSVFGMGTGGATCARVTRVRYRTGGSLMWQRHKREAESLGTLGDWGLSPLHKIRFQKNSQQSTLNHHLTS